MANGLIKKLAFQRKIDTMEQHVQPGPRNGIDHGPERQVSHSQEHSIPFVAVQLKCTRLSFSSPNIFHNREGVNARKDMLNASTEKGMQHVGTGARHLRGKKAELEAHGATLCVSLKTGWERATRRFAVRSNEAVVTAVRPISETYLLPTKRLGAPSFPKRGV